MAQVHLTFDNGPHQTVTAEVLSVLERRGLTATFFVLGKHLATPWGLDLAKRIRDAGHRLGNHSFNHETPLGDDPGQHVVDRELTATQDLLDQVWDGPLWFRPFGGGGKLGPHLLSLDAVDWLIDREATCVLWNSVPGDWLDAQDWPDQALADAERLEHDVIVLHDILPEAMTRLDVFLGALVDRGHTFTDGLPADCLPIVDGAPQQGLERFVSRPTPGAAP